MCLLLGTNCECRCTTRNNACTSTVIVNLLRQVAFEKLDDEHVGEKHPPQKNMFGAEKWCRFEENRMIFIFFSFYDEI